MHNHIRGGRVQNHQHIQTVVGRQRVSFAQRVEHRQGVHGHNLGRQTRRFQGFHAFIDGYLRRNGDQHARLTVERFQRLKTINDFLQGQRGDVVDLQIQHLLQLARRGGRKTQCLAQHVLAVDGRYDAMLVGIKLSAQRLGGRLPLERRVLRAFRRGRARRRLLQNSNIAALGPGRREFKIRPAEGDGRAAAGLADASQFAWIKKRFHVPPRTWHQATAWMFVARAFAAKCGDERALHAADFSRGFHRKK